LYAKSYFGLSGVAGDLAAASPELLRRQYDAIGIPVVKFLNGVVRTVKAS
jgi:hypothetical protein